MGVKDRLHATVDCTKARASRHRMRDFWPLSREDSSVKTGTEWLLKCLCFSPSGDRDVRLRNDVIHAKGDATIDQSVRDARFLLLSSM